MTKKNSHSDNEGLWSKRFDDDSDYMETNLSRSARKKAERGIPPILTTTIIFLVLLIILPVGAYIWWSSEPAAVSNEPVQTEEQIQVSKNSTSVQPQSSNVEEEREETEEPEETKTQEKAEEAEVQEETKKETKPETKEEPETETVKEETNELPPSTVDETTTTAETSTEETIEEEPVVTEEPEETSYNTYTVKPGDNLYRIALNHGMTTDELKQLNGITADSVQVGTVLRVE
ncbi:LysM peptidoglycan-binding domain-containing protein [Atopococcus tabaci]|uniref:LysM peptidoglycan-binding domain-containing protein n=1 Tax=Atopococcus tabaci TaxID=269774 RepID=UPI00040B5F82|nr:LysM peptidoglycan-binding domain-containing protein [Atopococcus tabaci]